MIRLENVSKSYEGEAVLKGFDAEFPEGRVTGILGRSGVGKTTLVKLLAGLEAPEAGQVLLPADCRISYVFQEPRLLPWYNVYANLDFVLKDLYPAERRREMILRYLELVGLEEYVEAPLSSLSGGMVQRVALCRAFLYPSALLLLDEPFQGLDAKWKEELAEAFSRIYQEDGRTVVFVTHDIQEALRLADTVYVLAGRPAEISGHFQRDEATGFDPSLPTRIRGLL